MDIGQLEAFDRIVREGSFSLAAESLGVAQPTVSARIRGLEREVGGALFDRRGRYVALTERGEAFLPYARRALQLLAEGIEAAGLSEAGARGRVTVGVIESLAGSLLARSVGRFREGYPEVELFVRAEHTEQIVTLLRDGVVRLGLLTWPVLDADLVPLLRLAEPLILAARADHPLAGGPPVPLAAVARATPPLLAVQWGPQARPLLARLAALERVPLELPIDTAREMVLAGQATAFLTETLIAGPLAAGQVVALALTDLAPLRRESALVRRRQATLPAAARRFARVLAEEAGALCVERRISEDEPSRST